MSETNGQTSPPFKTVANGSDRGAHGRFIAGNKAACGRSHGRRILELRAALLDAVGTSTIKRLGRKLVKMAETGNLDAMRLLFVHTLGKPSETPDPDELASREYERVRLLDRKLTMRLLGEALDPARMLEVLALLAGYASAEEFRKVVYGPQAAEKGERNDRRHS